MTVRLLAMAPSGEVFFTRDERNTVWRHRPLGRHDPVEVNDTTVGWVVNRYGYDLVDRDFETTDAAFDFVRAAVPQYPIAADAVVGPTMARSLVRVMERWLVSPADVGLIAPLVSRLLSHDSIVKDPELLRAMLSLNKRAAAILHDRPSIPQAPVLNGGSPPDSHRLRCSLNFFDERPAA